MDCSFPAPAFFSQRDHLRFGRDSSPIDDRGQVDQVLISCGRAAVVPLEDRTDFVSYVIDKRIGTPQLLLLIAGGDRGQRVDKFRFSAHPNAVGTNVGLKRGRAGEPSSTIGVARKFEQPTKKTDPVTLSEALRPGMRADCCDNCAGIVEGSPQGVGDQLSDRTWIFSLCQQIRRDSTRPSHWEPFKGDAVRYDIASVQTYVLTPSTQWLWILRSIAETL